MATAPDADERLTVDDTQAIAEELFEAQADALVLGRAFGLPEYKIRVIRMQFSEPREWLYEVISEVLKQTNPRPTWKLIVNGLRNPTVNLPSLARKVENAHFPELTASREVVPATALGTSPAVHDAAALESEIDDFNQRFDSIKMSTIRCLEKCGIAVTTVVLLLTSLLGVGESRKFLKEEHESLDACKTHNLLFGKLNFHWNPLSYRLLQSLLKRLSVENVEFEQVKKMMIEYDQDMGRFRKKTPLKLFCVVAPMMLDLDTKPPPPGFQVMVIEHDWPEDITLQDVEEFRRMLLSTLGLPECAMLVSRIRRNCFEITWIVVLPPNVVRLLKESKGTIKVFKDFKVTSVIIDGETVYQPPPPLSSPVTAFAKLEPFTEDTSQIYQPSLPRPSSPVRPSLPRPSSSHVTALTTLRSRTDSAKMSSFTLSVQYHEKRRAQVRTRRGSATSDGQFAYFTPLHSSSLYRYEYSTEKWEILPQCPYEDSGLAIINGELTTVGGTENRHGTNKLMRLRPDGWREEYPQMKTGRYYPAVATTYDGNYLFVIGGMVGEVCGDSWSATVELFQVKTREWYTAIDLPKPLYLPSATICGDRLNVIGGDGDGFLCSLQDLPSSDQPITSPLLLSWTPLPLLSVTWSTAAPLCGQLVLIGGIQGESSVNSIHQLVDGQWMKVGSMTEDRSYCLVVNLSPDKLLIVGGYRSELSVEVCTAVAV